MGTESGVQLEMDLLTMEEVKEDLMGVLKTLTFIFTRYTIPDYILEISEKYGVNNEG